MSEKPIVFDPESAARRAIAGMFTAALLAASPPAPAAEITSTWTGGGATNRWVEAANWSPVGVPNDSGADTYHVVIDGGPGQDVEVVLDLAPFTIQTLTIDAGDTLTLAPPGTLNIAGGLVTVNGTIQINPTNATGLARLIFPEDAQIAGAGEIHMMGQPGRCLIQIGNNDTLTLGETPASPAGNPIIHGRGVISGNALVNNSTISADQPGEALVFYFFNALTNNGVIEGVAGSASLGGPGVVSLDFTTMIRPINGVLRGQIGVNASQILGGTISQADVTFYPGSPTSPQTTLNDMVISEAIVNLAAGADPAFHDTTAADSTVQLDAGCTLQINGGGMTNVLVTGDPNADTDQVEMAGEVTLDSTTMEALTVVANDMAMRLANWLVLHDSLLRIFGQATIVPDVSGQPATVRAENSTIEAGDPAAMLDAESGIDFVWPEGNGVVNLDTNAAGNFVIDVPAVSLTLRSGHEYTSGDVLNHALMNVEFGAKLSTNLLSLLSFGVLYVEETSEAGAAPPVNGEEPATVTVNEQVTVEITDEASWTWDPGTILALAGGVGASPADYSPWTRLEIGGVDLGTDPANHVGDPAGFDGNFDLSILRIDPGAHAYLEDVADNGNRDGAGGPAEALYVDTLEFADGAGKLNLNGLHLYYQDIVGDPAQIIDEPVVSCPADVNGDGSVGIQDFLMLLGAWGPNPGHPADLDGDDVVGISDFLQLLADWGPCLRARRWNP